MTTHSRPAGMPRAASLRAIFAGPALLAAAFAATPALAAPEFRVVHAFSIADGANPRGTVAIDRATGALYGATPLGGAHNAGVLFRIADGQITTLHDFGNDLADGIAPQAGPLRLADGTLYGTTSSGGTIPGRGTLWRWSPTTGYETVWRFDAGRAGRAPFSALTLAPGGQLLGANTGGGDMTCGVLGGCGALFSFDPVAQTLKTTHVFHGSDGATPEAAPRSFAGQVWGTTCGGGAGDQGGVYAMTRGGGSYALHAVPGSTLACSGLTPGPDGRLWGVAEQGGEAGLGGIFRVDTTGAAQWMHSFHGPDGAWPTGDLAVDAGGLLVGTTSDGGDEGKGTVFTYDPATDTLTTLHSFHGWDGLRPVAGVTIGNGGRLYGTTERGGPSRAGVVWSLRR